MRMAREASTATTSRFVFPLKAQGEEQGEDAFEKRLAIAQELIMGRCVLKVDRNGPVVTALAAGVAHGGSASGQMVRGGGCPNMGKSLPNCKAMGRR
jgi:hypothetical protein